MELSEGDTKVKGTVIVLLSNEVPGREVEIVAEGEFGSFKYKKQKRIEAFEVVKEK